MGACSPCSTTMAFERCACARAPCNYGARARSRSASLEPTSPSKGRLGKASENDGHMSIQVLHMVCVRRFARTDFPYTPRARRAVRGFGCCSGKLTLSRTLARADTQNLWLIIGKSHWTPLTNTSTAIARCCSTIRMNPAVQNWSCSHSSMAAAATVAGWPGVAGRRLRGKQSVDRPSRDL